MKKRRATRKKKPIGKMLTDFYDLKKCGISQSSMKNFMCCRRKWMLDIAGLERKGKQVNTHFGTIVHEMLDMVYQKLDKLPPKKVEKFVRKSLEKYLQTNADEIFIETMQNDMEREMAIAITVAYFDFYEKDRTQFIEGKPEYEFEIPYNGVTLRGKIDGVFRKVNKELWQMEHKTKSRWDEESGLQALLFDFQNLMYSFALETESPGPIKGIIYNVIRKPQLRQKKTETSPQFLQRAKDDIAARPDWYFNRYEIIYTKRDKANFKEQLDGILSELKMFVKGELPDLQNQAHCISPYKCDFLPVCSLGSTVGLHLRGSIQPELDADFKPDTRILERYGIKVKEGRLVIQ